MKRSSFWKMPAVAAAFALALALVMTGCPTEVTPDNSWMATADDAANTTAINFQFNRPVSGLTLEDINLISGATVAGEPTGYGRLWSLPISVSTDGYVEIAIRRAGISSRPTRVSVGTDWMGLSIVHPANSGLINLTFDTPVEGLSLDHIRYQSLGGEMEMVGISGSGRLWTVEVVTLRAGSVNMWVEKPGVEQEMRSVGLTYITWDQRFDALASAFEIRFSAPVPLVAGQVVVGDLIGIIQTGALTPSRGDLARFLALPEGERDGFSGRYWTLEVTDVERMGTVNLTMNRPGVSITGGAALSPPGVSTGVPSLITWVASFVEGAIRFEFGTPAGTVPVELTQGAITLHDHIGAVTEVENGLSGGGARWELAVNVVRAGAIRVSIDMDGVWFAGNQANTDGVTGLFELAAPFTSWTMAARNLEGTTTAIDFTFAAPVTGLTASHIVVAPGVPSGATGDTADVTVGALTGAGRSWSLAVDVVRAGNVFVSIDKPGFFAWPGTTGTGSGSLGVITAMTTWTVTLSRNPDTGYSQAIVFAFSESVDNLLPAEVVVRGQGGSVVTAAPVGSGGSSGRLWTLPITSVVNPGAVQVAINRAGISDTPSTGSAVLNITPALGLASVSYQGLILDEGGTSAGIWFTLSEAVDLDVEDILIVEGTGAVTPGSAFAPGSGGRLWSLPLTVVREGTIYVAVNNDYIASNWAPHSVVIGAPPSVGWSVASSPAPGQGPTTSLRFTFNSPIETLVSGDVIIIPGTGTATPGAITGAGLTWEVEVTGVIPGTVLVAINRDGIAVGGVPAVGSVPPLGFRQVHVDTATPPAPVINWNVRANNWDPTLNDGDGDFIGAGGTERIVFYFSGEVAHLDPAQINLLNHDDDDLEEMGIVFGDPNPVPNSGNMIWYKEISFEPLPTGIPWIGVEEFEFQITRTGVNVAPRTATIRNQF